MTNISDLVQWDAREYNTYADHAANVALDKGVDWKQIDEEALKEAKASNASYRLSVDGALRGSRRASGGMALFAYYPSGRRVLILRAGVILGELRSAFLAEALSLEWCLKEFTILMEKVSPGFQKAAGSQQQMHKFQ